MPCISIDLRTYGRIVEYAKGAGVSVDVAARDAIDNWMDVASNPALAVDALQLIAELEPKAKPCVPAKLTFIDAYLNHGKRSPRVGSMALRRHKEVEERKAVGDCGQN
jgi:hypothetical protein